MNISSNPGFKTRFCPCSDNTATKASMVYFNLACISAKVVKKLNCPCVGVKPTTGAIKWGLSFNRVTQY
jgi:hypothetical protein